MFCCCCINLNCIWCWLSVTDCSIKEQRSLFVLLLVKLNYVFLMMFLNSLTLFTSLAARGSEFHLSATRWLKMFRLISYREFTLTTLCPSSVALVRWFPSIGACWNHVDLSTWWTPFRILYVWIRSWSSLRCSRVSIPCSLSLSFYVLLCSPVTSFTIFFWTASSKSSSPLCHGDQAWTANSRCGLKS